MSLLFSQLAQKVSQLSFTYAVRCKYGGTMRFSVIVFLLPGLPVAFRLGGLNIDIWPRWGRADVACPRVCRVGGARGGCVFTVWRLFPWFRVWRPRNTGDLKMLFIHRGCWSGLPWNFAPACSWVAGKRSLGRCGVTGQLRGSFGGVVEEIVYQ